MLKRRRASILVAVCLTTCLLSSTCLYLNLMRVEVGSLPYLDRHLQLREDSHLRFRESVSHRDNSMPDNSMPGLLEPLKEVPPLFESWSRENVKAHDKTLRQLFEEFLFPSDLDRVKKSVDGLRSPRPSTQSVVPYDIYNCPSRPPSDYPFIWPLVTHLLKDWNVDTVDAPESIYQGLCLFDWDLDRDTAEAYREAEVPFVLTNHPDIMRTTERWNTPGYLQQMIGDQPQRTDHSSGTNHLMFWRTRPGQKVPSNWKPPTDEINLTFEEWHRHAAELQNDTSMNFTKQDHWYLRLNANHHGLNEYLYDELPMFQSSGKMTFFMVAPMERPGINCRGGSKGSIAESHYDTSRNFIALLVGKRRYILSPPSECKNLELYPEGHPSAAHSQVDWSHPSGPGFSGPFAHAQANEVLLQAGDLLYLPDNWFHFIASLDINFQCNARSGRFTGNDHIIEACRFPS